MIKETIYKQIYKVGTSLICRNVMVGSDVRITPPTLFTKLTLYIGIFLLGVFIKVYTTNWNAVWILGKAYQRIGVHDKSYELFLSSYSLKPDHPDIIRELSGECLTLGKICEAEEYCRKAIDIRPNDPTLKSNLALAIAIRGDLEDAILEAKSALIQDLNNQIIKNTVEFIQNIIDDKIQKPDKIYIG